MRPFLTDPHPTGIPHTAMVEAHSGPLATEARELRRHIVPDHVIWLNKPGQYNDHDVVTLVNDSKVALEQPDLGSIYINNLGGPFNIDLKANGLSEWKIHVKFVIVVGTEFDGAQNFKFELNTTAQRILTFYAKAGSGTRAINRFLHHPSERGCSWMSNSCWH